MPPCSSKSKNIQPPPTWLLHQAVHDHQEALDPRALCGGALAVHLSENMGTKAGPKEVIDDTEAKSANMVHKDVGQVNDTGFPENEFLLTWRYHFSFLLLHFYYSVHFFLHTIHLLNTYIHFISKSCSLVLSCTVYCTMQFLGFLAAAELKAWWNTVHCICI